MLFQGVRDPADAPVFARRGGVDGGGRSVVALWKGHADGAEEQTLPRIPRRRGGVDAGCGVFVFTDEGMSHFGEVASDLVGAAGGRSDVEQGGLAVDRQGARAEGPPRRVAGLAIEGRLDMTVLEATGGQGEVSLVHLTVGKGPSQGLGHGQGEGHANPSCRGAVQPMGRVRCRHAVGLVRLQCGLLLGRSVLRAVGDEAREVTGPGPAGGDAGRLPDEGKVCSIRTVEAERPRMDCTGVGGVFRLGPIVHLVAGLHPQGGPGYVSVAVNLAAVDGLAAGFPAGQTVREESNEGLLYPLAGPIGPDSSVCAGKFFCGCGFPVHGRSSVRWPASYFRTMNMGSVKTDLYQGHDYYMMDDLLTEEHKLIRDAARAWVKQEVSPIIEDAAETQVFPKHILPGLGAIGAFGPYIPEEYGGAGLDQISYGIIMQELERCDSGLRSTASVQSSLVMYPIWKYGSEEQKMKYLPKLATGEMMGCFGLTEPDHGSNPGGMVTNYKDAGDGEHVILNGAKLWISNAPFADIAVVWAKNEEGRIHGIVVERGMEGFSTPKMTGKWSLRASDTGELIFEDVKVPKSHILPGRSGLGAPLSCLDSARYGIAWGAIGAALDCYDTALRYAKQREQFGRPIAGFQLQQKKLAEMITEITKAQLLTLRLGQLRNEDKATSAQISMAKRNNVEIALQIAREARQVLGGMGITGEYPIMRHMMNLESVVTYEGTHDIHLLITGLDITGENAFK